MIYSLIETCKRIGADPFAYLRDVLDKLPVTVGDNLRSLTPRAWLNNRRVQLAAATPA